MAVSHKALLDTISDSSSYKDWNRHQVFESVALTMDSFQVGSF